MATAMLTSALMSS